MKKNSYWYVGGLLLIGLVIFSFYWKDKGSDEPTTQNSSVVYYYGQECKFCKEVNKFLEENKISEKVPFAKKEVWKNKANYNEMLDKAKECKLSDEQLGVPFLYADGKCFVGAPDVTNYFKQAAGIK